MSIFSRSYRRQIKQYDNAGLGKGGWIIWLLFWTIVLILLLAASSRYTTSTWAGPLGSLLSTVSLLPNPLSWGSPYSLALLVTSFFCLWGLWQLALQSMHVQFLVAQTALFLLKLVSPVRGLLRSLFRRVRHDLLLTRLSPLHNPVYLWNSLPIVIAEFTRKNSIRIQFITIIFFGGIVIPSCQYALEYGLKFPVIEGLSDTVKIEPEPTQAATASQTSSPTTQPTKLSAVAISPSAGSTEPNGTAITPELSTPQNLTITRTETISFLQLMALGIISTFIFLVLWTCIRFVLARQRHLVLRFEVPDDDKNLTPIATILTHKFVAHLQQIGLLLSRQVENVNIRLENPLSLFVTSGQEEELIRQLSNLSDFEVSSIRLPVGRLLSIAVISLADTRVRGTVQRTHNGAIEAWVEFYSRKAKRSFEIERITIPNPTEELLNDTILDDMARELAVRLAYQLGHTYNLASSWESLKWFLAGLEASSKRNWWYAIANYKRATEIEETVRSSFGTGHYHIGATLLSQGEPHAALEHLQRAEASGPPSPETHYMLALTYLALNYENLDSERDRRRNSATMSTDKNHDNAYNPKPRTADQQSPPLLNPDSVPSDIIVHHLRTAIRLVENFPEAYHLLGIIYYQLARSAERSKEETLSFARVNYLYAAHYFRRAIRGYRKNLYRLRRRSSQAPNTEKERIRIVQDEMIATHHLADALRSLRMFREALEYYRDVQVAFPGRIRNLVDQAMTYCQWENWSMADDFITHEISQRTYAVWTADTQLYWAWAAAGSVNKPSKWQSLLHRVWAITRSVNKRILGSTFQDHKAEVDRTNILRSLTRLDMAIFLRPRFIFRRKQTDWTQVWKRKNPSMGIGSNLVTYSYPQNFLDTYQANLGASDPFNALLHHQADLWIVWRIYTYLYDELYGAYLNKHKIEKDDLAILLKSALPRQGSDSKGWYPDSRSGYSKFRQVVEALRNHRRAAAELLFISDQERLLMRPDIIWKRLQLCKQAYVNWELAHKLWETEMVSAKAETKRNGIQFAMRWQLDVYVQVATFTCRLLAHSQDYERLERTSDAAVNHVSQWIEFWANTYRNGFRFNPNLLRYHYITLITWRAYSNLMLRIQPGHKADIRHLLQGINVLQATAQNFRQTQHPLFLYVRAKHYQLAELHREAINDFVALLHVIEPFDSRSFNPFDFTLTLVREDLKEESKELLHEDVRTQLFYLERVSGQQQFDFLVNNAEIYRELALLLQKTGETHSSIDYLLRGLTWSPYKDFDMDNFVKLATSLLSLDMFREALAVVEEAKSRVGNYSKGSLRTSSLITLYVLECILRSRLENYGEALELGILLAEQKPFIIEQLENIPEEGNPQKQFANPFDHMTSFFSCLNSTDPTVFINKFVQEPETLQWSKIATLFDKLLAHLPLNKLANNFEEWRISTKSEEWLDLPLEHFDARRLEKVLATLRNQKPIQSDVHYEWLMIREIRLLAAKGACLLFIQACELYNNIAYNLAKLGIAPSTARRYSTVAIFVMHELIWYLQQAESMGNTDLAIVFSQRLAQYYDTHAWIYFRRRKKCEPREESDLQTAITILKDFSLAYDQNHPMPHYHLARAYLALAEGIWQDVEKASPAIPKVAEEIRHCLTQASHHWKIANSLDKSGRLTADLRACRQRINEYAAIWRDAHVYKGVDNKEN